MDQKSKKNEGEKVAQPGFEPGSLDPKSDALPPSYRGGKILVPKICVFISTTNAENALFQP